LPITDADGSFSRRSAYGTDASHHARSRRDLVLVVRKTLPGGGSHETRQDEDLVQVAGELSASASPSIEAYRG